MAQSEFHLSFYVLCAVLGWLALKGILGGRTMFEFPAVAAMMGLAWVVPQGIELEANPYNGTGSEAFWLYVTACFLFIAWGFRLGVRGQRTRIALAADAAPPALTVVSKGAGFDHLAEGLVETHAVEAACELPGNPAAELKLLQEEHHALFRRPPFLGTAARAGIEPLGVGGQQRRNVKIAAKASKPLRAGAHRLRIGQPMGLRRLAEILPGQQAQRGGNFA